MRVHRRVDTTVLDISLEQAWAFFGQPENLAKITPDNVGFEPLTGDGMAVYTGQIFTYRISPLAGIPMRWTTEISHVEHHDYFVDQQLSGPYALWHHLHRFRALEPEKTEVQDILHYAVPGGILGDVATGWWVRKAIDQIFAHRQHSLFGLFPPKS